MKGTFLRVPLQTAFVLGIIPFIICAFLSSGCSSRSQWILGAGAVGAASGAGVGYAFVHHGSRGQYETRNTIITSAIFALGFAGAAALHYRLLEQREVEISGRYSRYRLCDPEEMRSMGLELGAAAGDSSRVFALTNDMISDKSIHLGDSTKWVYPTFRQRFLKTEKGEDSVLSSRYLWEIVRPGYFVTRDRNPEFFLSVDSTKTAPRNPYRLEEAK